MNLNAKQSQQRNPALKFHNNLIKTHNNPHNNLSQPQQTSRTAHVTSILEGLTKLAWTGVGGARVLGRDGAVETAPAVDAFTHVRTRIVFATASVATRTHWQAFVYVFTTPASHPACQTTASVGWMGGEEKSG